MTGPALTSCSRITALHCKRERVCLSRTSPALAGPCPVATGPPGGPPGAGGSSGGNTRSPHSSQVPTGTHGTGRTGSRHAATSPALAHSGGIHPRGRPLHLDRVLPTVRSSRPAFTPRGQPPTSGTCLSRPSRSCSRDSFQPSSAGKSISTSRRQTCRGHGSATAPVTRKRHGKGDRGGDAESEGPRGRLTQTWVLPPRPAGRGQGPPSAPGTKALTGQVTALVLRRVTALHWERTSPQRFAFKNVKLAGTTSSPGTATRFPAINLEHDLLRLQLPSKCFPCGAPGGGPPAPPPRTPAPSPPAVHSVPTLRVQGATWGRTCHHASSGDVLSGRLLP